MFFDGLLHRFIWLAALVYLSCAAIRLARFNVENDENEMAHMSFVGLPSPGAAGVVVSLIIFQQEQVPGFDPLVYALPLATLGVGVLMVSRVRYPHIVNVYLRGKKPFGYLIRVLLFLGLVRVECADGDGPDLRVLRGRQLRQMALRQAVFQAGHAPAAGPGAPCGRRAGYESQALTRQSSRASAGTWDTPAVASAIRASSGVAADLIDLVVVFHHLGETAEHLPPFLARLQTDDLQVRCTGPCDRPWAGRCGSGR